MTRHATGVDLRDLMAGHDPCRLPQWSL